MKWFEVNKNEFINLATLKKIVVRFLSTQCYEISYYDNENMIRPNYRSEAYENIDDLEKELKRLKKALFDGKIDNDR